MSRTYNVLAPTLPGETQKCRTNCFQVKAKHSNSGECPNIRLESPQLQLWANNCHQQHWRILIATPDHGLRECQQTNDGSLLLPEAGDCGLDDFASDGFVRLEILGRLPGGKGGFGTLLRGKGARGPKTSNFDSSRYLDGRRVRVAQAPEKLRQWVFKKVQERAIIKSVGGEDKFLGKPLSSTEVIKKYKLQLTANVFDQTNGQQNATDQDTKQELRATVISSAIALLNRDPNDDNEHSTDPTSQNNAAQTKTKTPTVNDSLLDAYLDVSDDTW